MPRGRRTVLAGVPVHVVHRGHRRADCFLTELDRVRYLADLAALAPDHACAVHAYVLMSNHVHLLLTPADAAGLSRLMHRLAQRHAQILNAVQGRGGAFWEGRFRSSVVADDAYLFTCHRYIELNPVRAGLVAHPRDWPWSSYLANAEGASSRIVTPHPRFLALAADPAMRRDAYRALVAEALAPRELDAIRAAAAGNRPLGLARRGRGRPPKKGDSPL